MKKLRTSRQPLQLAEVCALDLLAAVPHQVFEPLAQRLR